MKIERKKLLVQVAQKVGDRASWELLRCSSASCGGRKLERNLRNHRQFLEGKAQFDSWAITNNSLRARPNLNLEQ